MSDIAISVNGLGKLYRLGATVSQNSLRDMISSSVKGLVGRNGKATTNPQDFWAVDDISFEVPRGEIVGVIGRNGAGKSTLLKLLSRITAPTTGEIRLRGRVNSLLEVGTGFHPELSGRENIYLNGAILGMQRSEIKENFDSIVEFSGVEKFLDTPVKRYSSGMYVRLAFAVAAHLAPDILLVDEVLAVGDAQFQERCLGRMKEVCEQGRTVMFVSHQMGMVAKLCTSGIYMSHGKITKQGAIKDVIAEYLHGGAEGTQAEYRAPEGKEGDLFFKSISVLDSEGNPAVDFMSNEAVTIRFVVQNNGAIDGRYLGLELLDSELSRVFVHQEEVAPLCPSKHGEFTLDYTIPAHLLAPGNYVLSTCLHLPRVEFSDYIQGEPTFRITDSGSTLNIFGPMDWGSIYSPARLQTVDHRSMHTT